MGVCLMVNFPFPCANSGKILKLLQYPFITNHNIHHYGCLIMIMVISQLI